MVGFARDGDTLVIVVVVLIISGGATMVGVDSAVNVQTRLTCRVHTINNHSNTTFVYVAFVSEISVDFILIKTDICVWATFFPEIPVHLINLYFLGDISCPGNFLELK